MTDGEAREMARELVRGSIIEDAASQFIAQILKHAHDERVKPLRKQVAALEAKLAKAVEALDSVMVGGNHLATILPDNFPPAETEPLIALETVGYGYGYEVWCCWRSIMLARTTLAELTGGKDE